MDKEKREKIDQLKLEAHRYATQFGLQPHKNVAQISAGFASHRFKNMPRSNRYGLAAILISYPGLIPIIAFGGANPLPQNLAIGCFALISMSTPFWLMAGLTERAER